MTAARYASVAMRAMSGDSRAVQGAAESKAGYEPECEPASDPNEPRREAEVVIRGLKPRQNDRRRPLLSLLRLRRVVSRCDRRQTEAGDDDVSGLRSRYVRVVELQIVIAI